MPYRALATDYDGTLARLGKLDAPAEAAIMRLRDAGIARILVTGRVLDELRAICPRLDLFDRVVVENGAVIYRPDDGSQVALAEAPPIAFLWRLDQLGVDPVSVGRVIVATWRPHEGAVARAIEDMGLDLRVILNKRAVMVLPAGVDKATGLAAALRGLGIDPAEVVAVGDAENDEAMLAACGCGAAVGNALSALKAMADVVLDALQGDGVVALIDRLLADDMPPPRRLRR